MSSRRKPGPIDLSPTAEDGSGTRRVLANAGTPFNEKERGAAGRVSYPNAKAEGFEQCNKGELDNEGTRGDDGCGCLDCSRHDDSRGRANSARSQGERGSGR